jgi:transcriptional regulator with XRE-family HTH domain
MRLEAYRRRERLTYRALAERLDMGASTVEKICKGGGTTVDNGFKIHEGTGGAVTWGDLRRRRRRRRRRR